MRSKRLLAATAVALMGVGATAAAAEARFTIHEYRVTRVVVNASVKVEGTQVERDDDGNVTRTTSEQAQRTASLDYHGRRGDFASFVEVPRRTHAHGEIYVTHSPKADFHQTGSYTVTYPDGPSDSGTCNGDTRAGRGQIYTALGWNGRRVRGVFDSPLPGDVFFSDQCPVDPLLSSPRFKWSLPASKFRRHTVVIKLAYSRSDSADGIQETEHWDGKVTLRRRAVCHTNACVKRYGY